MNRATGVPQRLVLVVMSAGYFLVLLDVTVVNVALPRIGTDLRAGLEMPQWVVDGYAIALASVLLTAGTVGDSRGHRAVVLAGFGVFGLASLACTLAPGAGVLVAVMNLGTFGLLFVLTLYLRVVQGRSALAAGMAVLPLFVPLAVLAPVAGRSPPVWARGR
jgi:DHA2 family methylenomycin A resistance protein-like MFS transporter